MQKEKKSFFERLTGTVKIKDEENFDTNDQMTELDEPLPSESDADLAIDMYETQDAVIIKAFIAGVSPEDLDVNITRELVTISGSRVEEKSSKKDAAYIEELFWGSFSRTVTLPVEIDVEESEAMQKHGMLTIIMPKLDKKRQMKLKVKSAGN